ncbi:hypothetical protein PMI06_009901 [Burkholderia sp. BT03]|nr:hypothetical protein PMI06_009901 [Burkholderia sp. BT03]SKC45875.1 hypothetical protein SAMN06266956_0051 [Paraburkholderia hospita]
MGVAIGSAGSGKSVIEVNGNGMTRETIAVTLEAVGVTTMTAGGVVTGTATKEMTAGGMTTKTNGVGCCVRCAGAPDRCHFPCLSAPLISCLFSDTCSLRWDGPAQR